METTSTTKEPSECNPNERHARPSARADEQSTDGLQLRPGPMSRRGSQSPGNPFSPGARNGNANGIVNGNGPRPSPPNGYGNGRPSPPGMRQPVPRHPPGHGNAVTPQQIEQQSGVSHLYPPKASSAPQVRSLTGSASASAGSGDSNRSAPIDSEPSAHSSASSLGPRRAIGVR